MPPEKCHQTFLFPHQEGGATRKMSPDRLPPEVLARACPASANLCLVNADDDDDVDEDGDVDDDGDVSFFVDDCESDLCSRYDICQIF